MGQITPIFVHHYFRLFDPSSWLSWIIRKVTRSEWNHSAILYSDSGMQFVVESRSGGVMVSTLSNWLEHRPDKRWAYGRGIEIDLDEIRKRFGNKYNVPSLFAQLIYQYLGVWIGSTSDSSENCSQLLADILKLERPYLATPRSLYEQLK